ncbi:MAG: hypothetical protein EU532_06820 [Promethearchaeota archaeon]|nr:MAG: hypothetical protein EU532_06820 [Candidatus Lokiarchaeota archaeon]
MSIGKICAFISLWDNKLGPNIIATYPKLIKIPFDLELISSKIFFAFQEFYYSDDEKKTIQKTYFNLTINEINRKAVVLLDSLEKIEENDKIQQAFIIVALFPAHLSDHDLDKFKNIIFEINMEYTTEGKVYFDRHFAKIEEIYSLEESVKDSNVFIDEEYQINHALLDFERGLELFSQNQFESAYIFLKKAYLKFNTENNVKLLLESLFFLSSTLTQLKKYNVAQTYIENLELLSSQLSHQKYYETSLFMGGFCLYKREEYEKALEKFRKLESIELHHINQFNFFYFYGQILRILEFNTDALISLEKALEIISKIESSNQFKDKKADLLIELGHVNYTIAIKTISSNQFNLTLFKSNLQKSIIYYEKASKILEEINNFSRLILVYRLIGNIHELLGNYDDSDKNYRNALNIAEQINDVFNRLQLFNLIIQNLSKLERYERIVEETDNMLSKIRAYAYLDLYTISNYHQQIGEALFKLGKYKDALSEFLIALNIFDKFDEPILEKLDVIQKIIKIYEYSNHNEKSRYIDYYTSQLKQYEKIIHQIKLQKEDFFAVMKEIKEFWIFALDGTQLYSYAPETKFNPELFGGFLIALQSFSKELATQNLKSITIGSNKYTFFSENNYFFILGRSDIKSLRYKIEQVLMIIHNEFLENYQHVLEDFKGESNKFSNFLEIMEKHYRFENKI